MEHEPSFHVKDISKKLVLVSTVLGSSLMGSAVYRAVSPNDSVLMPIYSIEDYESELLAATPIDPADAIENATEPIREAPIMLDLYACYPINNLLSPKMIPDITCEKRESDVHEWMKSQSQNLRDEATATPLPERGSIRRLERDIYAAADSCNERVAAGASYSVYDDYEKNLDGCYRIFGFTADMIDDYEKDQKITSETLTSRVVTDEESALTIRDSLAPGEVGFRP